ncbi:RNA polymerase sigma factor [Ferruginibacter sp. SUN106]|uniref:RNA polymerase sigma factor n=1 Tax=Ferruginibacter sp. SUN106 TaxID=2978348 RepID=UPI003D369017
MKSTTTLTDEQAVQQFLHGDSQALELLINRHKNRIFTSISLLVKDRYLAEDLFQDLFIKIIETLRAGKYNEENKFLQWAMRIAHNLCIDHFRKLKNAPVIRTSEDRDIFDVLDFKEPNAEEKLMKTQSHNRVMQMVSMLPEEQREVIILRHFADLKFKEISELLQCSVNTALGRMRYGLLNMRKIMQEKELAL